MGRKKAVPVKPKGVRSTRRGSQPVTARAQARVTIPAATLKELRKLVELHRSGDRTASWDLGRLASRLLGHTEKKPALRTDIAKLAEDIGLITPTDESQSDERRDESSMRQLMKFARIATKRQATALHRAGVAWRGVVYWIGVKNDDQRGKLYDEMVSGMTNSTEIRAYIKTTFKKKPLPRFSGDCAEDFRKARNQADSLASVLDALGRSLDKHEACGSARQRRQLTKALENTREQINATMRKMRKRG